MQFGLTQVNASIYICYASSGSRILALTRLKRSSNNRHFILDPVQYSTYQYKHYLTWAGNATSGNTSKDSCRAVGKLVSSSSRETAVSGRGWAILDFRFTHAQIKIILEAWVTLSSVHAIISCGNKIIEKTTCKKASAAQLETYFKNSIDTRNKCEPFT